MPLTTIQDFIWQHRDDDPRQLALSAKKHPNIPIQAAAAQVQALQKIRHKIPSWYRAGMEFPLSLSLEQASSERTALFKAGLFSGKTMVDLTGGLGVDAFFFAQRFESFTYVEQNAELLAATQHNFGQLGTKNVRFVHDTAEHFLENTSDAFDLIYLDPARRDERKGKVFLLGDCSPDVLKIKDLLLKKAKKILVKTAPMLDLRLAAEQLGAVSKIWVIAADGDCREVLYLMESDAPSANEIPIEAVNLSDEGPKSFAFSWGEELRATADFSSPQQFLYEPNPAIMKAGAFKSFAKRFGLGKLHPNTHLFTAASFSPGLPARSFAIEHICKYDRKAIQSLIPNGKANIACRNFPDNPEQVRRKLGLADGGEVYLFAATISDQSKVLMVCRKV